MLTYERSNNIARFLETHTVFFFFLLLLLSLTLIEPPAL